MSEEIHMLNCLDSDDQESNDFVVKNMTWNQIG